MNAQEQQRHGLRSWPRRMLAWLENAAEWYVRHAPYAGYDDYAMLESLDRPTEPVRPPRSTKS
ncbi:MAG: hypothetical protein WD939_04215 [Dehalococcoidia bacterium]